MSAGRVPGGSCSVTVSDYCHVLRRLSQAYGAGEVVVVVVIPWAAEDMGLGREWVLTELLLPEPAGRMRRTAASCLTSQSLDFLLSKMGV